MSCVRKSEDSEQYGFQVVPTSLDGLTKDWCDKAFKTEPPKCPAIASDVFVSAVELKKFQNEISGISDGGGFSGSELVRVIPTYSGNINGDEPSSCVCKLSHGGGYKLSFLWRFMMYMSNGGGYDEYQYRQETNFLKYVLPVMETTLYKYPKMYFYGIEDKGDRGFGSSVLLDKPTKVKSVILMEDMKGWRSSAPGVTISKKDAILCVKNVAILHATFWGENEKDVKEKFGPSKSEKDYRPGAHSKAQAKFRKFNFKTDKIQKSVNKIIDSDWKTSPMTTIRKGSMSPDWLTVEALENGDRPIFGDPLVLEMLGVLAAKAPNYNRLKLKNFLKKPLQTILHGDFHAGNHMYGVGEHEGKIVALDYQWAGTGRVATEFIYFFMQSLSPHSYEEVMDIFKTYHDTLVMNGVDSYDWEEFKDDIEMSFVEICMLLFGFFTMMKPKTLLNLADGFGEKGEALRKMFENGMYAKFYVFLTSIYLNDKDGFLTVKE